MKRFKLLFTRNASRTGLLVAVTGVSGAGKSWVAERLAGEPMDVLVNGTLVAHGEVVVVNEKFGIRLTDVISPAERVKKLK